MKFHALLSILLVSVTAAATTGATGRLGHNDSGSSQLVRGNDGCPGGWVKYGSTCYMFSAKYAEWVAAKKICEGYNDGALARPHTRDINDFLNQESGGSNYFWFDLSERDNEGTWAFSDGSAPNYSAWAAGQPSGEGQHCAYLNYPSAGAWANALCTARASFICQMAVDNAQRLLPTV